jgi:hypothetical protein
MRKQGDKLPARLLTISRNFHRFRGVSRSRGVLHSVPGCFACPGCFAVPERFALNTGVFCTPGAFCTQYRRVLHSLQVCFALPGCIALTAGVFRTGGVLHLVSHAILFSIPGVSLYHGVSNRRGVTRCGLFNVRGVFPTTGCATPAG